MIDDKLSEILLQDHLCGDFGSALEGYSEKANSIENKVIYLEGLIDRLIEDASEVWGNGIINGIERERSIGIESKLSFGDISELRKIVKEGDYS